MTEHLPECTEHLPECWATYPSDPPAWCICDELRDCEERMLNAAREAVAALDAYYALEECQGNPLEKGDPEDPDPWQQGHLIERDDALAAIDALREKP